VKIVRHDTIDSTNEEARRLAEAGETGPCWIVAAEQTAGRGRRGRTWISERGNLFATLLISPTGAVEQRMQLSFVAGLAAADTIACYSPDGVTLKWPNDVLLFGRKVAGMLLESFGPALVVGFGINLAHFPHDTGFPATSLAALVRNAPSPDEAFTRLAAFWNAWYEAWRRDGFAPVRAAWLARASGLGESIRVRVMDREMNGVFENVDDDGALLLRAANGTLARITAGDVFLGS